MEATAVLQYIFIISSVAWVTLYALFLEHPKACANTLVYDKRNASLHSSALAGRRRRQALWGALFPLRVAVHEVVLAGSVHAAHEPERLVEEIEGAVVADLLDQGVIV
jgi:hypothetical protein